MSLSAFARSLALLALCVTPASAIDWYVDGQSGSDANSGTSPTDAWKSITWALANTPTGGVQRIHIAPAGYGHTTGEVFPLALRPGVELIGMPGPLQPVIGWSPFYSISPTCRLETVAGSSLPAGAHIRLENLGFTRGGRGVEVVHAAAGVLRVELESVRFDGVGLGMYFAAENDAAFDLDFERVEYESLSEHGLGGGVYVKSYASVRSTVSLRDSSFVGGYACAQFIGVLDVRAERSMLGGAIQECVLLGSSDAFPLTAEFESCAVVDSSNYGFRVSNQSCDARFTRCTIADNGLAGVSVASGSTTTQLTLDQCIVSNDTFDLVLPVNSVVRDSLIRSGQYGGSNGNFAADPLFADPASGDWSLRWGSPAIDRIADAGVASTLDLSGRTRGVDGDLDLLERSDLGAFEFRPLAAPLTARIGSQLRLSSWGPQGAASTIYWARSAPVGPTATPFGQFALPAGSLQVFSITSTGAAAPTLLQRAIPNVAQLVGQTYSFQALVDSPAAPLGRAYTNVAPVTFEF